VLAIKLRRKAKLMLELEQASHDKEMLVIEVRHRVKNMIQMTSSLLQLQEGALRSDEARAALREAQSRLLVMASVYEALIHPDSDGRLVNVGALVEMLTAALSESGPLSDTVRITTDCEAILLDVDSAVPLGLIVNEAVTNALKHAFPDDQAGEIFVDLRKSSKSIRLVIRDNGRGFAAARREGSLGMRLMTSLARQLRASLTVDGSNGGRIELAWTSALAEEITEKQSLMLQ
jgi:two-component sensor histidine kinase